jgi:hypothetical protein
MSDTKKRRGIHVLWAYEISRSFMIVGITIIALLVLWTIEYFRDDWIRLFDAITLPIFGGMIVIGWVWNRHQTKKLKISAETQATEREPDNSFPVNQKND